MKTTFLLSSLSLLVAGLLSSCATGPQHEKPIRPTSENSNIAHGSSSPTDNGGGFGGGFDALAR